MRQEEKVASVAELVGDFGRATVAVVVDYRGLTAGEFDDVRRTVRAADGRCRVAKNRLAKRAIADTPYAPLAPLLRGPTALIMGFQDPIAVAKATVKLADSLPKLEIRGAVLDGKTLPVAEVKALAALPSREVILAQLLGLLQAPATQLVRVLNEPAAQLARLVKALSERAPA
ncbi:MAG TPA: 50S ribosomal protein L10 [Candidatus Limnocylindria bacterium]|nr:50S ribosomal protein L10 [Candidatus Limnocylindria bacterium]